MSAKHDCCCAESPHLLLPSPEAGQTTRRGVARHFYRVLSGVAFLATFLLPKCPLCVAAWAATLGVGAAGQHYLLEWFDPRYRSVLTGLFAIPILLQMGLVLRSRVLGHRVRMAGPRK